MTRQEFIELSGLEVNEYAYGSIEPAYMMGELEKDKFCRMWVKLDEEERLHLETAGSSIVRLGNRVCQLEKILKAEREEFGKFLVDEAMESGSMRARDKAIKVLGFKEYITYKLEKGYEAWEQDMRDMIKYLA